MTRLVEKYFPHAASIIATISALITLTGAIVFNQIAKNVADPSLAAALLFIAALLLAATAALAAFAYETIRLHINSK